MSARAPHSIVSPSDQKVTFVELFFDLVFVFSVTQIVGLFHEGFEWHVIGQGVLVFWLVWWAWTQFTWARRQGRAGKCWRSRGSARPAPGSWPQVRAAR